MNVKVDELLPSAADCSKKMAEAEAAKASDYIASRRLLKLKRRHSSTGCRVLQAYPMKSA